MAAVAIAVGSENINEYLKMIVPPIVNAFGDVDGRVKYYACESLYNIAKVARVHIIVYFDELFDVLAKVNHFCLVPTHQ